MRTVTALQAGRSLGALLDQVQAGESIVITRDGKRIAVIEPAAEGNGAEVLALLRALIDADFARDVALPRIDGSVVARRLGRRRRAVTRWDVALR